MEPLHWGEGGAVSNSSAQQDTTLSSYSVSASAGEEQSEEVVEPMNYLLYTFNKFCKASGVRRGTETLKNFFGFWTEDIGLENVDLYPNMNVLDLRQAYLGSRQLMVLADVLRVETVDAVTASNRAVQLMKQLSNPPKVFHVSRLPELQAISLRGMCLDYSVHEQRALAIVKEREEEEEAPEKSVADYKRECSTLKCGGNAALRYFFAAISGHPSLEKIDLSSNAIGPHALPALVRLVKNTPSLTKVKLSHTLLKEEEVELVNAVCLLNKLRKERAKEEEVATARDVWRIMQINWLRNVAVRVLKESQECSEQEVSVFKQLVENLVPKKIPPLFRSQSAFIRIVEPPNEVVEALKRFHLSPNSSYLLERPQTQAGAGHRLGALAVGDTQRYSHLFNNPFMHYNNRSHDQPDGILSAEAEDILRSAFENPRTAELTFLKGRKPCPSLPTCKVLKCEHTSEARRKLKHDMCASMLLSAVRRILLPEPQKPKTLLAGETNRLFYTSEEEHYLDLVATQERQWNYILDKLVDFTKPAYFNEGESIYQRDDHPYWLWFIPPSDTEDEVVEVTLLSDVTPYPSPAATDSDIDEFDEPPAGPESFMVKVRSGEFFGDRELFGTTALYIHEHNHLTGSGGADLGLLREKYKKREGAAIISVTTDSSCMFYSSFTNIDADCMVSKKKKKQLLLYHIPFEVALFYLFEPYQKFHLQGAHVVDSLPTLQSMHPSIATMLGYILRSVSFTVTDLSGVQKELGTHQDIMNTTYILDEGDFIFGAVSPKGKWNEKQLMGGSVVTNSAAYNIDAKARRMRSGPTDAYQTPQILGKDAAIRHFRQHRKKKPMADTSGLESEISEGFTEGDEYTLSVGTMSSHWRYYYIKNADWFCLPADIRLALSNGCIVAGERRY